MNVFKRLRSFINVLTSSIAFYPTLYAFSAILFAFVLKFAESQDISAYFSKKASVLLVNDVDTARNILTTMIAGGLSMLVFSFSMVMLLLSQAAANYSPRVLPNLIANRRHQLILGTFLAMILYNIITIIGIEPQGEQDQLPSFSVLVGIITAIIALGAFVYFIHSISSSIQINNIMKNIFSLSRKRLQQLIDQQKTHQEFPDTKNWASYTSTRSGTLQNISISGLQALAEEFDTKFEVCIPKGEYLVEQQPYVKSERELSDDEQLELHKNFNFNESEMVRDNYILGFKQLTEIGIKAMSPGINDPGTAVDTVNYIFELLALRMKKSNTEIIASDDGNPLVKLSVVPFDLIIYNILVPYRTYCKHDMSVMQKLLTKMVRLLDCEMIDKSYRKTIYRELKLLMHDVEQTITNPVDLGVLNNIYNKAALNED